MKVGASSLMMSQHCTSIQSVNKICFKLAFSQGIVYAGTHLLWRWVQKTAIMKSNDNSHDINKYKQKKTKWSTAANSGSTFCGDRGDKMSSRDKRKDQLLEHEQGQIFSILFKILETSTCRLYKCCLLLSSLA